MEFSEKMEQYHAIYCQLYDNPFIPISEIAQNTNMSEEMVSQLLDEMYSHSILKGPMVFLKPPKNYQLHVYFLEVREPFTVFKELKEAHILLRSMGRGDWNIMVISNREIDITEISGFKKCVYQGEKGVTFLSQVTGVNWQERILRVRKKKFLSNKKTSVYETIPEIPWGETEWELFERFKLNVSINTGEIKEDIPEKYTEWISQLSAYARVQPAFYPEGLSQYCIYDYLFCSQYQRQITQFLSALPTTAVFFSTGEYLLARLFVNHRYVCDVLGIVAHLKHLGCFTEVYRCHSLFSGR
jgi:DNA-binding Lrp family transcriptional regulator